MKKQYFSFLVAMGIAFTGMSQSFTNSSNLLDESYNSGGVVGVVDMDQDGYDDIMIFDNSRMVYIAYQGSDGAFTIESYGSISGQGQWGATAADIDNNGHNDIFSGGSYDGVHHLVISERGQFEQIALESGSMFMQACNLADMNNDGWLDAFACHDDAESRIWGNDGLGDLVPQNDWIDMTTTPASDNSGNYGSVWCDFDNDGDLDLYIAKCRQGVNDPMDPRRINVLFVNDGEGNFTEEAEERGLVIFEQSWTVDFADIDNDADFDCFLTNHSGTLRLLENDGNGYFTDITEGSGLEYGGFFLQAKMADMNNDGFVDLLYSGGTHRYLVNNGDKTFSDVPNAFPADDTMHSFGIGDLNTDGHLDVYASYGDGYISADNNNDDILWINDGNDNNWVGFDLEGTVSNRNAIGARVEIYGDFGVQIREVRAGESYGITTSFKAHFGIGENESVDFAVVRFPSGIINVIENPTINNYNDVLETDCEGPAAALVSSETGLALCEGESTTLDVTTDENFVWSNGSTELSVTVESEGVYSVTTFADGCGTQSEAILVEEVEVVIPDIAVNGELEFCEGGSLTLIAPSSPTYNWSNGGDAQAIQVTESGVYTVEVASGTECGDVTSNAVEVMVLDAPEDAVVEDAIADGEGNVTFTGDSEDLLWFDEIDALNPVAEGMEFSTNISENSTFYVQSFIDYGGQLEFGGRLTNDGPGGHHDNSTFYNLFDAYEDIVIKSVKVYASGGGMRTIELIDSEGTVIESGMFDIQDGESRVDINFSVPEGSGYALKTVGNPQLWRNSIGTELEYPYEFNGLAAITGTNITGDNEFNYYYFFYDWEVEVPSFVCLGDRIEVEAIFTDVDEIDVLNNVELFPNPVNDELTLRFELSETTEMSTSIIDATGRTVLTQDLGTAVSGAHLERINVSNLAKGIYFVRLEVGERQLSTRIIVE